ncbi:MAG: PAS domain S-box protein, partial [Candidatus Contendobacter sp.]|nr:PAS domain S-box protein [Candidatus Contendobacter sp.]
GRDGSQSPVEVFAHYLELDGHAYNCALAYRLTPQRQTENALRASEERLALALAVSGQGLYDLNIATGQTVFSDEYARMLGYEPSELELTPAIWASWLHPEDREQLLRLFEDCVTGKRRDYRAEFRLRTRSGDWIWVLSMGKVVDWDAAGRPLRMVGTHLNITERKRAEEALRLTQIAVDRVSVGVFWFDAEGTLVYVNEQACRSLGYSRDELVGAKVTKFDPDFPKEQRAELWRRLRSVGLFAFETWHRRKDGSRFPVEVAANYIAVDGKEYNFAFARDITERKRTEAALLESEERFAKAFRASPAPMALSDIETGRLLDVNEQVLSMLNYTREEMIGRTSTELGIWADSGTREQLIARLRTDGFFREAPVRFRTKTGRIREVLFSAEQIRIGAQNVMLSLLYDITERKQAEAALRASETFLDSIIAQSPLPIVIFDTTGKIVRENQASRTLFHPTDGSDFDEKAFFDQYNLFQDEQLREQGYLPLLERVFSAGETVRFQSHYDVMRLQFPSRPAPCLDLDSTTFPVKDANGDVTHAVTYHLDITDRKAAETKLRYHLDLEQAMAEISALMIKPGWEDFAARVNWTLERIGHLTQVDRSYLFLIAPDGLTMSNTHEWCAQGIRPQMPDLQNLPTADYQPFYDLLQREVVEIQTARLPDDTAFKPILLEGGVRALICVAVSWSGKLRGFIGFDAVTIERVWLEEDIRLLRMVAEIIAHTLQHIESDRALRDNAHFLENLDRISHILTRREKDADVLAELAAAILDIFQADRAFFLHPCDPDAARFHIRIEATRPEWPGVFTSDAEITPDGVEIVPDDVFRRALQQTLRHNGPMLSEFTGASEASGLIRHYGIQSQMVIALYPQSDQPWVLGAQQCAYLRQWTQAEQRLFQTIAERVSDALSGHLLLKSLKESEERFAKAFRANPAPMAISIIETGQFLDVNEQWLKMLGYTRAETIGHTSMELDIWADPGMRERMIAQLRVDGFFQDAPVRFRTKAGAILEVLWSAETVRLGKQGVLLSLVYDISERKRAEEALRTSEAFLEAVIEHSPHSMWVSDDRGVLIRMNQACRDMLHVADEDLVGKYNIFEDNIVEQQGAMPLVKRVFEQGEKVWFTIRYDSSQLRPLQLRGVTQVILEVTISPVLDAQKRVIHAIIQHINITERKRVEEELQRHREHLEELVDERTAALEQANAELRQAMAQLVQSEKLAALGSLVAGVAHELNTPLGNARVVASSLGEHLQDFAAAVEAGSLRRSQVDAFLSRGREAVDLLERNTARAADLISHFKQVAVDQTSTRRRLFNLGQTVEEVLVTLRPQFKRTAHRIELEIPPDLELDSYPGPLEQVIANLITNSLTHGFVGMETGCIRIEAAPLDAGHIRLRYGDDGAGIPETIRNRIFEPFFTTKLGGGGSGLGLYIVYNLVTGVLGGTVQVQNPPGLGVAFDLILPTVAPALPTPAPRVS